VLLQSRRQSKSRRRSLEDDFLVPTDYATLSGRAVAHDGIANTERPALVRCPRQPTFV
jgi:hypothetical protein